MTDLGRRSFMAMWMARQRRWRVAIIGHTGRGNYGHDLDIAFRGMHDVDVLAVADPVEEGRQKALARTGAKKGYADYREMLRVEKPEIVAICPRWLDQRVAMVEAVSAAGAHILMEKAFAATLEDGDAMVRAVGNRKLQLLHTARLAPSTIEALKLAREGAIGEILELRARGKEDRRAGGEDMLTLGTHIFDLMRLIAGNPVRCTAKVVGPKREPTEFVGPVAGDSIMAAFEFASGVNGYFASQKNSGPASARYGVTVFGSQGAIDFPLTTVPNTSWILRSPSWRGEWKKIEPPDAKPIPSQAELNPLLARDLMAAIVENRKPACSAEDGLWTIEMIQAVYASSLAGGPVTLPLKNRHHPLL